MNKGALGLIEVYGYLGAIEAADTALKAANVTLVGCEKVRGGIVTVKIRGDVGAVNAAVYAAEESVNKISKVLSVHVIPRPDVSVWSILEESVPLTDKNLEKSQETEAKEKNIVEKEIENVIVAESISEEENLKEVKAVKVTDIEVKEDFEENLEKKTVEELRRLVRSMKLAMTNKQIKFARKDRLIQEILNFYKGRNK